MWGPRQSGKSTLLKQLFPKAYYVDLLRSDQFLKYHSTPYLLREEVLLLPKDVPIIIDEVQMIPLLLNEVHGLIENHHRTFGLCGSSARRLKRGHANMLGGRAVRYELYGLCSKEIGKDLDLIRMLNHGYLPSHYTLNSPLRRIKSYIGDYLKEEVAAEGLSRNLPAFSDFLRSSALGELRISKKRLFLSK